LWTSDKAQENREREREREKLNNTSWLGKLAYVVASQQSAERKFACPGKAIKLKYTVIVPFWA